MVDRTRKLVRVFTGADVDIKYTTLKSALAKIQDLIAQYGEDAEINVHTERWSDSEYLGVFITREETDEELEDRIKNEEIWEANWAARDRAEYQRLKQKFEG